MLISCWSHLCFSQSISIRVGFSSVSPVSPPAPITRRVSLAIALDLSSWRECTLTLDGILGRSDKLNIKWHKFYQYNCCLLGPTLQIGSVVLPLHGFCLKAVEEVCCLLLGVGGLQHHAIESLHADGALVTMSKGLRTKILLKVYCMTSCNVYQIDHLAPLEVLLKSKSCYLLMLIYIVLCSLYGSNT